MDSKPQHKKKSALDGIDKRVVRAYDRRKLSQSQRHQVVQNRRANSNTDSPSRPLKDRNQWAVKRSNKENPADRRGKLEKWRAERELKRKLRCQEAERKKPMFKITHVQAKDENIFVKNIETTHVPRPAAVPAVKHMVRPVVTAANVRHTTVKAGKLLVMVTKAPFVVKPIAPTMRRSARLAKQESSQSAEPEPVNRKRGRNQSGSKVKDRKTKTKSTSSDSDSSVAKPNSGAESTRDSNKSSFAPENFKFSAPHHLRPFPNFARPMTPKSDVKFMFPGNHYFENSTSAEESLLSPPERQRSVKPQRLTTTDNNNSMDHGDGILHKSDGGEATPTVSKEDLHSSALNTPNLTNFTKTPVPLPLSAKRSGKAPRSTCKVMARLKSPEERLQYLAASPMIEMSRRTPKSQRVNTTDSPYLLTNSPLPSLTDTFNTLDDDEIEEIPKLDFSMTDEYPSSTETRTTEDAFFSLQDLMTSSEYESAHEKPADNSSFSSKMEITENIENESESAAPKEEKTKKYKRMSITGRKSLGTPRPKHVPEPSDEDEVENARRKPRRSISRRKSMKNESETTERKEERGRKSLGTPWPKVPSPTEDDNTENQPRKSRRSISKRKSFLKNETESVEKSTKKQFSVSEDMTSVKVEIGSLPRLSVSIIKTPTMKSLENRKSTPRGDLAKMNVSAEDSFASPKLSASSKSLPQADVMSEPASEVIVTSQPPPEVASQPKVEVTSQENEEHGFFYFRDLVEIETKLLNALCDKWEAIFAGNGGFDEDVGGQIRSVIGQAYLLIAQRFKQFLGLVDQSENKTGEKPIHSTDLQGFWDMVFFQVEDVNIKFLKLDELRAKNWVQETETKPVVKNPRGKKPKPVGVKKPVGKSKFAAFRAKMKRPEDDVEVDMPKIQVAVESVIRGAPVAGSPVCLSDKPTSVTPVLEALCLSKGKRRSNRRSTVSKTVQFVEEREDCDLLKYLQPSNPTLSASSDVLHQEAAMEVEEAHLSPEDVDMASLMKKSLVAEFDKHSKSAERKKSSMRTSRHSKPPLASTTPTSRRRSIRNVRFTDSSASLSSEDDRVVAPLPLTPFNRNSAVPMERHHSSRSSLGSHLSSPVLCHSPVPVNDGSILNISTQSPLLDAQRLSLPFTPPLPLETTGPVGALDAGPLVLDLMNFSPASDLMSFSPHDSPAHAQKRRRTPCNTQRHRSVRK